MMKQPLIFILCGVMLRRAGRRQHLRAVARVVNATINSGVCPKCGGHLVERNGKYGTSYGCSNYPKCRFTTQCVRDAVLYEGAYQRGMRNE